MLLLLNALYFLVILFAKIDKTRAKNYNKSNNYIKKEIAYHFVKAGNFYKADHQIKGI